MRKPFIAGNWKMNTDSASAVALAAGLAKELSSVDTVDVAVCPPFVYLQSVAAALSASNIALGSQNVYFEEKGAFTGEISCAMLKDTSCAYAIIGHSERRHVMGESDAMINKKISAAISGGLLPIFCVGELLEERQGGTTNEVVAGQI
ncbi:MAG: triose-phosphate isomerase family protein, partial [Planctomycetota bacterium]